MLNKKLSTKDDLSEDCYVAMFGHSRDILDKLNKALNTKFGKDAPVLVEEDFGPAGLMAYAYLFKTLQFKKEFNDIEGGIYFKENKVKVFGICGYRPEKHSDIAKQIRIYDYKNYNTILLLC